MPGAAKIQLTQQQQDELERCAGSRSVAVRAVERAKIILALTAGKAKKEIAEQLGIVRQTVRRWEQRFLQQGTKGLEDAPRSGRPRRIQPEQIAQIVQKTTQETPSDSTHWSTRSLAQVVHVSPSSVGRIWREKHLKPHRVRTFKLSNDREFAEKTDAIVTLYLNPPPHAVVWSADEQCQLQALSRTQPSLPCVPGHDVTKTNDYKRHGTTNLFAAMNVHSGKIVYTFHPQHRHEEWIQFLSMIEAATPPGMEIHLKAGMNVVIEAGMELTIKASGGFINIGPAGVAISGTLVLINSGGAAGSGSGSSPQDPQKPDEADDGSKGGKM